MIKRPKKQRTSAQTSGDKVINQVIGARIAAKRRAMGMDMAEFSAKIGVSLGQLSRYESGETPLRITMITFIARHLGCKAGELVDGE
jgi:transcriptional regulator with XRE-family HTH domain